MADKRDAACLRRSANSPYASSTTTRALGLRRPAAATNSGEVRLPVGLLGEVMTTIAAPRAACDQRPARRCREAGSRRTTSRTGVHRELGVQRVRRERGRAAHQHAARPAEGQKQVEDELVAAVAHHDVAGSARSTCPRAGRAGASTWRPGSGVIGTWARRRPTSSAHLGGQAPVVLVGREHHRARGACRDRRAPGRRGRRARNGVAISDHLRRHLRPAPSRRIAAERRVRPQALGRGKRHHRRRSPRPNPRRSS